MKTEESYCFDKQPIAVSKSIFKYINNKMEFCPEIQKNENRPKKSWFARHKKIAVKYFLVGFVLCVTGLAIKGILYVWDIVDYAA